VIGFRYQSQLPLYVSGSWDAAIGGLRSGGGGCGRSSKHMGRVILATREDALRVPWQKLGVRSGFCSLDRYDGP